MSPTANLQTDNTSASSAPADAASIRVAYPINMLPWPIDTPIHGIGRYMFELAKALVRFGPELGIQFTAYQDPSVSAGPFEALPLRRFPALRDQVGINIGAATRAAGDAWKVKLARGDNELPGLLERTASALRDRRRSWFLAKENISLIHYGFHLGNPVYPRSVPLVATVHDLVPQLYPETAKAEVVFGWRQFLRAVPRITHFIAVSEATADDLVRHVGVPRERVSVTVEGVDAAYVPPRDRDAALDLLAKRYGITPPFILHVSTLEPRKNEVTVVRALTALPKEVKLVLAGKPGWRNEALFRTIDELNLGDRVLLPGFVPDEDLPHFYGCASVFVYPSLYEGFGLPLLESMACGTPVLSSNSGSLPEVCGDAALLLPPTDVGEWAQALQQILTDTALRARLIQRGHERVKQYTWRRAAEQTIQIYREVVAAHRPR